MKIEDEDEERIWDQVDALEEEIEELASATAQLQLEQKESEEDEETEENKEAKEVEETEENKNAEEVTIIQVSSPTQKKTKQSTILSFFKKK